MKESVDSTLQAKNTRKTYTWYIHSFLCWMKDGGQRPHPPHQASLQVELEWLLSRYDMEDKKLHESYANRERTGTSTVVRSALQPGIDRFSDPTLVAT